MRYRTLFGILPQSNPAAFLVSPLAQLHGSDGTEMAHPFTTCSSHDTPDEQAPIFDTAVVSPLCRRVVQSDFGGVALGCESGDHWHVAALSDYM